MTTKSLGPYRLGEIVEARAVAVTYRAVHDQLGRPALVKTLKPTVSPASPLARALACEATALSAMAGEGAAAVYDFERTATALWFAVEAPEGERLRAVLGRAHKVSPAEALAVTLGVARALGAAHQRGVVGVTARPRSIVLTQAGRVLLVEAEGAHLASDPAPPRAFEGGEDERTAGVEGESDSPQADVFAAGALLYRLVVGEPLAPGERGTRALRAVAGGAPTAVMRVLSQALGERPSDRYADGARLAEALDRALLELSQEPAATLVRGLLSGKHEPTDGGAATRPADAPSNRGALVRTAAGFAILLALVVLGGLVARRGAGRDAAPRPAVAAPGAASKGSVRVLARPWADVYVDGEKVDTTPIGQPIVLAAGTHYLTFKHPQAPDEERQLVIAPGQSAVIDVSMRVVAPAAPASATPTEDSP